MWTSGLPRKGVKRRQKGDAPGGSRKNREAESQCLGDRLGFFIRIDNQKRRPSQLAGDVGDHQSFRQFRQPNTPSRLRAALQCGHHAFERRLAQQRFQSFANDRQDHRSYRRSVPSGTSSFRIFSSVAVVENPARTGMEITFPPAASTSSLPTIASLAQSPPFARISG